MRYYLTALLVLFSLSASAADVPWLLITDKKTDATTDQIPADTTPPVRKPVVFGQRNPNLPPLKPTMVNNPTPALIAKASPKHHHHNRVCSYQTGGGVFSGNNGNGTYCPPATRAFIPIYPTTYVVAQPIVSEINETVNNDEFVIDDNRIIFTNIWHGTCHQSECSVTAGYLASNPLVGIVLMTQPELSPTPLVIYSPTLTGPLRIVKVDIANSLLTLQSLNGNFQMEDTQGNVLLENGQAKLVGTPGGANYIFDLGKAKFVLVN